MKLIAHRGASAYSPENTLAAFRIALEMGATAVELDVQETHDRRLVVLHDETLKRTTGNSSSVGDVPYGQLAGLDAGKWFSPSFAGERVPLLEEVLGLLKGRTELHVELKGGGEKYPGIERRLADLLRRTGWAQDAVVSSFHHASLQRVRELAPRARLGLLAGGGFLASPSKAVAAAKALACESVHVSLSQSSGAWAREARHARMKLLVYTVNRAEDALRLERLGVDAVFTNHPDLLSRHWEAVGGTQ